MKPKSTITQAVKITCLFPECSGPRKIRGLCPNHYAMAHHLVKRRMTSWDVLERNGKALPTSDARNAQHREWFLNGKK